MITNRKLTQNKTWGVVLLLLLCLFLYSLTKRTLHIDEAILGEHAYWLAKVGKVKANLYTGTGVGWEDELLVFHKLFIWSGAFIISIFGLSLPLLRVFILFFACILCAFMYFYCRNYSRFTQKEANSVFLISLVLLFLNSHFFAYSFIYRPEIMQACLGFGSFYFIISYLENEKRLNLILAACLAGLGALTHLNGLIYIGAGSIILLINNKIKPAFIFGSVAAVVSSMYLINMVGNPEIWERFIWQFKGDPALEEHDLSITDRFIRLFHEHKRYFHTQVEGAFTVLLLLSFIIKGKYLWKNHRNLLLYPLICAFFLACISQGLTSKYALLYIPHAILMIAISIHSFLSGTSSEKKVAAVGLVLLIFAGINLHDIAKIFRKGEPIEERNTKIASKIPEGSHVYTSFPFFFNEVEHFQISSTIAFVLLVDRYQKLHSTKEDLFKHVNNLGAQYIIIDLQHQDRTFHALFNVLKEEDLKVGTAYRHFEVVTYVENDFIVMKHL